MTMSAMTARGYGRTISLGLACCALAACSSGGPASPTPGLEQNTPGGSSSSSSSSSSGGDTGSGSSSSSSSSSSSGSTGGSSGGLGSSSSGGSSSGSSSSGGGSGSGSSGGTTDGGSGSGSADSGSGSGSGGSGDGGGACPAGAVFCDGFESSAMLGAGWTVDNSVAANTVTVVSDKTKAHSGTNSVHMTFTTASCATFIDETMGVPATGSYWARVWILANTAVDSGHDVYFEAEPSTFKGGTSNTGVRALNTQGNMSINIAPPDNGATSTMALPRGVWTCFEWNTTGIGGTGGITTYMNGTQLMTATGKPIPALAEQRIGYERYGTGTVVGDMYIDDYAIGAAQLGCN